MMTSPSLYPRVELWEKSTSIDLRRNGPEPLGEDMKSHKRVKKRSLASKKE
jgi:hypothetical protein